MNPLTTTMTIGGAAVAGDDTFPVLNPATGNLFTEVPNCSLEQLDAAFESAQTAFAQWRSDTGVRQKALLAMADLVDHHTEELATLLSSEQGKPLRDARTECSRVSLWFRYFAELEVPDELIRDDERGPATLVRSPLGVVAAITPWNFPLSLAAWKLAPALRAGNTVVLKPSPFTPVATLRMGALFQEVLPAGVLNVVSGVDPLGAAMTSHEIPRKISFTGSVATGRLVGAAAAQSFKRCTLELGGNDPAIVMPDAQVDKIARGLFWSSFANSGQICMAIKRIYAPASIYDQLVEELAARASRARIGDPFDDSTHLGPISNEAQLHRVARLVDEAAADGAVIAAGGKRADRPGYFYEPTIVAEATHEMALVHEEQFGPALPIIRYDDVEEAIAAANNIDYGLGGSVWGSDVAQASKVADRIEAGTTWVNQHLTVHPDQPFGGWKSSGIGVENGIWGYDQFTNLQVRNRP